MELESRKITGLLNTNGVLEKIYDRETLEAINRFFEAWVWRGLR